MDGDPPVEGHQEDQEARRVYPPHEVQARLEVSASGLRRLAGIYERTVGPLPRDDRGRVWPEDAVEALKDARVLVRESRAVSIEAALRGQETGGEAEPYPATQRPSTYESSPAVAILEELRALRQEISELREEVRTGWELEAGPEEAREKLLNSAPFKDGNGDPTTPSEDTPPESTERGLWQHVASWFGFGPHRS